MRRSLATAALAALLMLIPAPADLEAQARAAAAADATVSSRYVWRGLTRRNGWVLQPNLVAGALWGSGSVSVGAWANIELARARPASQDLGLGDHFGEWNLWLQIERTLALVGAPLHLAVGYNRYFVDRTEAAARGVIALNTGELYVDGRWRLGDLEPRATLWYDPEEVKGAYGELGVGYRLPVFPLAVPSLYAEMLYGFSWGQAIDEGDPTAAAYFAENGLTHIDFSVEAQIYLPVPIISLQDLYATPFLHFQVNLDEATRRASRARDDADRGNVWWGGVSLSWFF